MALKIRRGLSTDRTDVTPAEGEFLFDKDTKRLYIGDAVTPGGNSVFSGILTENQMPFAWGDVGSKLIMNVVADTLIHSVYFVVLEAYNGAGAIVTVGTDATPDLLVSMNDIDLTLVGEYLISPGMQFLVDTDIKIFNTPGSGAFTGKGVVVINF